MLISVVIPSHNEEEVIAATHSRLVGVLERMDADYELVYVDDGSTDSTWSRLLDIRESAPGKVVLLRFTRNFGHQSALTAGLEHATGDYILIIDADLQDPPELLPEMLEKALEGNDVVYGVRRSREGESAFKKLSAYWFYRVLRYMSKSEINADAGDFRLVSRRALDSMLRMPERHRFLRGMFSWIGYSQCPVYYDRSPREMGETKYTFWKMVAFSLDAIFSFSAFPLRLATYIGFTLSIGSMLFFVFVFYIWLAGKVVPGWSSLIAAVIFIGGIQLIITGIAGEYIGRIYEELKGRPLYILSEKLGPSDGGEGR